MHKVYLNVSPTNILRLFTVVNEHRPRRNPIFFEVPYSRIKTPDKTLPFKGPKLYNSVVGCINKEHLASTNKELHLERHFLNAFKTKICCYLSRIQERGGDEWDIYNFALYN